MDFMDFDALICAFLIWKCFLASFWSPVVSLTLLALLDDGTLTEGICLASKAP